MNNREKSHYEKSPQVWGKSRGKQEIWGYLSVSFTKVHLCLN
jgi:hypothetical protein